MSMEGFLMGADIFGFSGVEALIFDMDGVLAETIPAHIEAWHDFSRSMGHELTTKEIVDWMGADNRYYLERIMGRPVTDDEVAFCVERKEGLYRERMRPYLKMPEGLRELLDEARGKGVKLAVATGAPPDNVRFILEGLHLEDDFKVVVDSTQYSRCKPAPDCYLAAARRLGVEPAAAVVFEDAVGGIRSAKAAGMRVVALEGTFPRETLLAESPSLIITSFSELPRP